MAIVKARKLGYEYYRYTDDDKDAEVTRAIDNVDLDVEAGDFVAILGHNGSGKSTLAKHINALLTPTEGTIWIDGTDTKCEEDDVWKIRQKAGIVFQNPDNQIIGSSIEEDVGFGPENVGIETKEIWERVEEALEKVGMLSFREHSPNRLSGGQKQRVAIAGIVAMRPECIVLDEPTAMLDPDGRKEVLKVLRDLNEKEKVTIILITHYMEEVVFADRVFVMEAGSIIMKGTPREIFGKVGELKAIRLDVPQITLLAHELKEAGMDIPEGVLTRKELTDRLTELYDPAQNECAADTGANSTSDAGANGAADPDADIASAADQASPAEEKEPVLELKDVTYTYGKDTVYEMNALTDINLKIGAGEFIALIGHTGSGKSTLIQLFNGLLKPTSGQVIYKGCDIASDGYDLRKLRTGVGLVFQYPENQLFETDVLKDVCFGPKNQGLNDEEAKKRAADALISVGIPEELFDSSPFDLSGGQKRRVAIAGILAMKPHIVILDEPTAGLDPEGRDSILNEAKRIHEEENVTVVLVSHSMEDVARYAERIIVLNSGKLEMDDTPKNVFARHAELENMGLGAPEMTYVTDELKERGMNIPGGAVTVEEAKDSILKAFGITSGKTEGAE